MKHIISLLFLLGLVSFGHAKDRPPNFIVIFADDLGYGDLSCFGHPTIHTPNLDRMAREGMKFTQFYSAAPVCTPSRAALMTGRLPARNGMCSNRRRVLFPNSKGGLPQAEITIAESLSKVGYKTACVGKWHLGHLPKFLPTSNGFQQYFGIPYSNDMDRIAKAPRFAMAKPKIEYWNVPLMRNTKIIERPADQRTITRRYTAEAVKFIRSNKDNPFFLYLPQTMPHIPLFRSKKFRGKSRRGRYGDVIEEIDWSVGQILTTLKKLKIDSNTLVLFTSDNGPWRVFGRQGGTAGLLRGGKGSTFEGGMREPTLAWWPGMVAKGSICREVASTMDVFATLHHLAGVPLPKDRTLDTHDLTPLLFGKGKGKSTRKALFYYRGYKLMAVRRGPWKMHFFTQRGYGQRNPVAHDPPMLNHLEHDPAERFNVARQNPKVIAELKAVAKAHQEEMKPAKSQLEIR